MTFLLKIVRTVITVAVLVSPNFALSNDISSFVGSYVGSAKFIENGSEQRRDMNTKITKTTNGFNVNWTSVTYKADGRAKEKTYTVEFVPSQRKGIFASAMKTNVFGKQVPLDPLAGEPFVWAQLDAQRLTVFSLFINEAGNYEMQEYHRSLQEGGLMLEFRRLRNGREERSVQTFLTRN